MKTKTKKIICIIILIIMVFNALASTMEVNAATEQELDRFLDDQLDGSPSAKLMIASTLLSLFASPSLINQNTKNTILPLKNLLENNARMDELKQPMIDFINAVSIDGNREQIVIFMGAMFEQIRKDLEELLPPDEFRGHEWIFIDIFPVFQGMCLTGVTTEGTEGPGGSGGTGSGGTGSGGTRGRLTSEEQADIDRAEANHYEALSSGMKLLDGLVGLLTYGLKAQVLIIGILAQGIGTLVANIGGPPVTNEPIMALFLTPDMILFNKVPITSLNFFDFQYAVKGSNQRLSDSNPIYIIRENIAIWYVSLRNLAVVILLAILIYIGIRMAISTIAEEKAKYKRMIFDWFLSIALIFIMHYIIIITINANNLLVELLWKSADFTGQSETMGLYIAHMLVKSWDIQASVGWGSAIVYCMIVGISLAFLLMYIKRMISIGFLILISPLITITYSIDRIADNKSQALDTWLKGFVFNILIQPFHCLIYIVFVGSSIMLLQEGYTIGNSILSIFCLLFIWKAEEIVRKIFSFPNTSIGTGVMAGAAIMGGLGKLGGLAKKGEAAASGGSSGNKKVPTKSTPSSTNKSGSAAQTSRNSTRSSTRSSTGNSSGNSAGNSATKGTMRSRIANGASNIRNNVQSKITNQAKKISNSMNKANRGKTIKKAVTSTGKYIGKAGKFVIKANQKVMDKVPGMGIAMGIMGMALSGKPLEAFGGYSIGKAAQSGIKNTTKQWNNKVKNGQAAQQKARNLVNPYQNVMQSKTQEMKDTGLDTNEAAEQARKAIEKMTREVISMGDKEFGKMINEMEMQIETGVDEANQKINQAQKKIEQDFVMRIHSLAQNYQIMYDGDEDDVLAEMKDTFRKIDEGKITPPRKNVKNDTQEN